MKEKQKRDRADWIGAWPFHYNSHKFWNAVESPAITDKAEAKRLLAMAKELRCLEGRVLRSLKASQGAKR